MMKSRARLSLAALMLGAFATPAAAQLLNRPYDFPGAGGPGASVAARQAILIHEIAPAFTPEFLIRAPGGGLMFTVRNPNGSDVPLVFSPEGFLIPSYRPSFRGDVHWQAGVFNEFFAPGSDGLAAYPGYPNSVSAWTGMVLGRGGVSSADAITEWTTAAYNMDAIR